MTHNSTCPQTISLNLICTCPVPSDCPLDCGVSFNHTHPDGKKNHPVLSEEGKTKFYNNQLCDGKCRKSEGEKKCEYCNGKGYGIADIFQFKIIPCPKCKKYETKSK